MSSAVVIVVFPSTHHALRAERAAKKAAVPARMVPVPRGISSDCGIGMEAEEERVETLRRLFSEDGVKAEFVPWERG